MRIAVCDDEKISRTELISELNNYAHIYGLDLMIYQYTDGAELLDTNIPFDVIFMDQQMKQINGIDTVAALRKRNDETTVVFVSSYAEVVFDSMKVNTFRFLVKPFKRDDLFEAMDSIIKNQKNEFFLLAKSEDLKQTIKIYEKEIIYAQASDHYVIIVTDVGQFIYTNKISKLENELTSPNFFKTNRSYIVNFNYISKYSKKEIELNNGHKALLSYSLYNKFKTAYLNYIKSKGLGE